MRLPAALPSLILVTAVGCSTQPTIDVDAQRSALMDTDRAWFEAYSASDNRPETFVENLLEGASLLPPDAPLVRGRDAIRVVIGQLEATPGFSITWTPSSADVGSGDDLGYTMGTYRILMDGPDGQITIDGKYLTIWKKQSDGRWLVTADMFNADAPTPSTM